MRDFRNENNIKYSQRNKKISVIKKSIFASEEALRETVGSVSTFSFLAELFLVGDGQKDKCCVTTVKQSELQTGTKQQAVLRLLWIQL